MEAYLMSLGVDVWSFVSINYVVPDIPQTYAYGKKVYGNNAEAQNAIIFDLNESKWVKLMHYKLE